MIRAIVVFCLAALLASCDDTPANLLPTQKWQNYVIGVEIRPPELRPGNSEFLVVATQGNNLPVYNLLVSIRIGERQWRQSIQDGRTGVYRRALMVRDPANEVLQVRLEEGDKQVVLNYPLKDGLR